MRCPGNSIAHRDCCIGVSFPLVALEKYRDYRVLTPSSTPVIVFCGKNLTDAKRVRLVLDFLDCAVGK